MKDDTIDQLSTTEKRAASSLATIYSLRMLGLFMILPVFSLYAQQLQASTPFLIGVGIGAYGLTQALLQIPYGLISDRIGRKPVIIFGLLLFALGSIIAAMSDSIYGVIIGRAIQGSGAIAAAVMALAADLTREEHRLKIMATIGVSIGLAFAVAMILGSVLNEWIGVDGIFWFTAALAVVGIGVTIFWVPDAPLSFHRETEPVPEQFTSVLADRQLLRLDFGIFILHMVLSATFIVIPLVLVSEQYTNLPSTEHWKVYLPVMLLSMGLMIPFIILAEKKRRMKPVFSAAIAAVALAELGFFAFHDSIYSLAFFLLIFFAAFNILEASLPSLISKQSPTEARGTAMGIYSTSQFLGAFTGGVAGGAVLHHYGVTGVFLFAAAAMLFWFIFAVSMKNPRYLTSYVVKLGAVSKDDIDVLVADLTEIRGVAEAVVIAEDDAAYLKVELHALDKAELQAFSLKHRQGDK